MSDIISQYKELAVQEQKTLSLNPSNSLFTKIYTLSTIINPFYKNSKLETLLLQDNTTFKQELTNEYAQYDTFNDIGDVFNIRIPHPLTKYLNDDNIPHRIKSKITKEIEDSPVVVFIHGLGGNFQQFDEQIKEFHGKFCEVLSFDLPGSGQSSDYNTKKFKLTLDSLTHFVIQFLSRYYPSSSSAKKLVLIGHSFGTQIIINLINQLQDSSQFEIIGVTLLAPPKVPQTRSWFQWSVLSLFYRFPILFNIFRKIDRLNNLNSKSMRRLFHDGDSLDDFIRFKQFKFNLSTNSVNILNQVLSWVPLPVAKVIESFNHMKITNKNPDSSNFWIIDGDDDKLTHDGGESYKKLLGSGVEYLRIDNCGHNLTLDKPEQVNKLLSVFVKGLDARFQDGYFEQFLGTYELK